MMYCVYGRVVTEVEYSLIGGTVLRSLRGRLSPVRAALAFACSPQAAAATTTAATALVATASLAAASTAWAASTAAPVATPPQE